MNRQTFKNRLDDAQLCAVFHNTGPALVVAGPGSGKTTVILNRVQCLIQQCQIPPEKILVLTFTKAAAKSLQNRFFEMTGGDVVPVSFGTFHSFFYQILRQYGSYKNSNIISTKEKYSILRELGVNDNSLLGDVCYVIGILLGNPSGDIQSILPGKMSEEEMKNLLQRYTRQLQLEDLLDFDQMAGLTLDLFSQKPYVLKCLQEQYQYVLVDEFQDTNPYQYDFLKQLTGNRRDLFAVGDDDQAIYSFRGSSPSIMRQFQNDFHDAKCYFLTINYRSGQRIVNDANKLIACNQNRLPKEMKAGTKEFGEAAYRGFETGEQEHSYIVSRITNLSSLFKLSDMAIIGRTNKQMEQIAKVLGEAGIPYQINGSVPQRRYSAVTQEVIGLIEYIQGDKTKGRGFRRIGNIAGEGNPSFWMDKHAKLFMNNLAKNKSFLKYVRSIEEDENEVNKELTKLLQESSRHKSLGSFLEQLKDSVQTVNKQADGIQVLTMHGSKGLEFMYVCLIDINEGIVPGKQCVSGEEIEEERRMLYVGMTRAKKILDVCYLKGTKEHPRLASRFLNPLLKGTIN